MYFHVVKVIFVVVTQILLLQYIFSAIAIIGDDRNIIATSINKYLLTIFIFNVTNNF